MGIDFQNKKLWKKGLIGGLILFLSFSAFVVYIGFYSPKTVQVKEKDEKIVQEKKKGLKKEKEQVNHLVVDVLTSRRMFGTKDERVNSDQNLLVLELECLNQGNQPISYNPLQFHLVDDKGAVQHLTLSRKHVKDYFGIANLSKNQKAKGLLMFAVPKKENKFILYYQNGASKKTIATIISSS